MNVKMKQQLKAKAHALKPVVMIGNKGLTDAVQQEIDLALTSHELIKIKIAGQDKAGRHEMATLICQQQSSELIQSLGNILILYRKNPDK